MPRGKKFTAEQIIGKLRETEVGLAQGTTVPEVVRKLGVTERTFYRWIALESKEESLTNGGQKIAETRSIVQHGM